MFREVRYYGIKRGEVEKREVEKRVDFDKRVTPNSGNKVRKETALDIIDRRIK